VANGLPFRPDPVSQLFDIGGIEDGEAIDMPRIEVGFLRATAVGQYATPHSPFVFQLTAITLVKLYFEGNLLRHLFMLRAHKVPYMPLLCLVYLSLKMGEVWEPARRVQRRLFQV